eukprot:6631709-Prymnesium_polylepis.1
MRVSAWTLAARRGQCVCCCSAGPCRRASAATSRMMSMMCARVECGRIPCRSQDFRLFRAATTPQRLGHFKQRDMLCDRARCDASDEGAVPRGARPGKDDEFSSVAQLAQPLWRFFQIHVSSHRHHTTMCTVIMDVEAHPTSRRYRNVTRRGLYRTRRAAAVCREPNVATLTFLRFFSFEGGEPFNTAQTPSVCRPAPPVVACAVVGACLPPNAEAFSPRIGHREQPRVGGALRERAVGAPQAMGHPVNRGAGARDVDASLEALLGEVGRLLAVLVRHRQDGRVARAAQHLRGRARNAADDVETRLERRAGDPRHGEARLREKNGRERLLRLACAVHAAHRKQRDDAPQHVFDAVGDKAGAVRSAGDARANLRRTSKRACGQRALIAPAGGGAHARTCPGTRFGCCAGCDDSFQLDTPPAQPSRVRTPQPSIRSCTLPLPSSIA